MSTSLAIPEHSHRTEPLHGYPKNVRCLSDVQYTTQPHLVVRTNEQDDQTTQESTVYAAGTHSDGRLGWDQSEQDLCDRFTPVPFFRHSSLGQLSVRKIVAGPAHCIALLRGQTGRICAWGKNDFGQLGIGTNSKPCILSPQLLDTIPNVSIADIAAGGAHSACVTENGIAYTWGCNAHGALGIGDEQHRNIPTRINMAIVQSIAGCTNGPIKDCASARVVAPPKFQAVTAGIAHTLFLTKDWRILACGRGSEGQLGMVHVLEAVEGIELQCACSALQDRFMLHQVHIPKRMMEHQISGKPNNTVVAIRAGGNTSGAILSDGSAWVWGDNKYCIASQAWTPAGVGHLHGIDPQVCEKVLAPSQLSLWRWKGKNKNNNGQASIDNNESPTDLQESNRGESTLDENSIDHDTTRSYPTTSKTSKINNSAKYSQRRKPRSHLEHLLRATACPWPHQLQLPKFMCFTEEDSDNEPFLRKLSIGSLHCRPQSTNFTKDKSTSHQEIETQSYHSMKQIRKRSIWKHTLLHRQADSLNIIQKHNTENTRESQRKQMDRIEPPNGDTADTQETRSSNSCVVTQDSTNTHTSVETKNSSNLHLLSICRWFVHDLCLSQYHALVVATPYSVLPEQNESESKFALQNKTNNTINSTDTDRSEKTLPLAQSTRMNKGYSQSAHARKTRLGSIAPPLDPKSIQLSKECLTGFDVQLQQLNEKDTLKPNEAIPPHLNTSALPKESHTDNTQQSWKFPSFASSTIVEDGHPTEMTVGPSVVFSWGVRPFCGAAESDGYIQQLVRYMRNPITPHTKYHGSKKRYLNVFRPFKRNTRHDLQHEDAKLLAPVEVFRKGKPTTVEVSVAPVPLLCPLIPPTLGQRQLMHRSAALGHVLPWRLVQQQPSCCDASAGHLHSLVTTIDGDVWTWGLADKGQLGLAAAQTPRALNIKQQHYASTPSNAKNTERKLAAVAEMEPTDRGRFRVRLGLKRINLKENEDIQHKGYKDQQILKNSANDIAERSNLQAQNRSVVSSDRNEAPTLQEPDLRIAHSTNLGIAILQPGVAWKNSNTHGPGNGSCTVGVAAGSRSSFIYPI